MYRLESIIPEESFSSVLQTFQAARQLSLRINPLKTDRQTVIDILHKAKIDFSLVPWYNDGLILGNASVEQIADLGLIETGKVYIQNLSSMLVPCLLAPGAKDKIMDMCAAPGSKATQMAAMMDNRGQIICLESVKKRFYKCQSIAAMLGVKNMQYILKDARKFCPSNEYYDKILVDAPCSSEGRFRCDRPKSYQYWSLRKIKEMSRKQKGLILSAGRLLKPNGILVYSTCTFSPEENEGVIDWFLKKTEKAFQVVREKIPSITTYPPVLEWNGKVFQEQISQCLRILPDQRMEGFFIAKLKRISHASSKGKL